MSDDLEKINISNEDHKQILQEVSDLLGEPYSQAKKVHIWAEEEAGEHNWLAMVNFRDALDHVSKIFEALEENNLDKANQNLAELRAHIYRAAYDSAQLPVEKVLDDVIDQRLPDILYRITLSGHMPDYEFRDRKNQLSQLISEGRQVKAESPNNAIEKFQSAYEIAQEMDAGTPKKMEVSIRLLILFGVVSIVIALLLSFIP